MNFFVALFSWIVIAAVLILGIVKAANGAFLFLGVGVVLFLLGFIKWGCASH